MRLISLIHDRVWTSCLSAELTFMLVGFGWVGCVSRLGRSLPHPTTFLAWKSEGQAEACRTSDKIFSLDQTCKGVKVITCAQAEAGKLITPCSRCRTGGQRERTETKSGSAVGLWDLRESLCYDVTYSGGMRRTPLIVLVCRSLGFNWRITRRSVSTALRSSLVFLLMPQMPSGFSWGHKP